LYRPAYIVGVTNPIFETSGECTDLLMDIGTGRVAVSKDIRTSFLPTMVSTIVPMVSRTGTIHAEGSTASEE
ncbi:hypothetical protein BU15DRAFT_7379, partial [Melanogaster broomeanus]